MTRKRFTKLAMSVGYSRNEANSLSKLISYGINAFAETVRTEMEKYNE